MSSVAEVAALVLGCESRRATGVAAGHRVDLGSGQVGFEATSVDSATDGRNAVQDTFRSDSGGYRHAACWLPLPVVGGCRKENSRWPVTHVSPAVIGCHQSQPVLGTAPAQHNSFPVFCLNTPQSRTRRATRTNRQLQSKRPVGLESASTKGSSE